MEGVYNGFCSASAKAEQYLKLQKDEANENKRKISDLETQLETATNDAAQWKERCDKMRSHLHGLLSISMAGDDAEEVTSAESEEVPVPKARKQNPPNPSVFKRIFHCPDCPQRFAAGAMTVTYLQHRRTVHPKK